jgi:hypothetical protein
MERAVAPINLPLTTAYATLPLPIDRDSLNGFRHIGGSWNLRYELLPQRRCRFFLSLTAEQPGGSRLDQIRMRMVRTPLADAVENVDFELHFWNDNGVADLAAQERVFEAYVTISQYDTLSLSYEYTDTDIIPGVPGGSAAGLDCSYSQFSVHVT